MTKLHALIERWRGEAELFRRRGQGDAANLVESLSDDLEVELRTMREESVNLTEAAKLSGYSADHLGELVRSGEIPNAGRKNAPRIRMADIPRKAGFVGRGRSEPAQK